MKDYEDEAFDELEKKLQKQVATGVTDGSLWRKRQKPEQEPVNEIQIVQGIPFFTPPQRTWVGLMRGVRVEGDTVVISTKDNTVARELCGALIGEKNNIT